MALSSHASCPFCIHCGSRMEQRQAFGRLRAVCPACGHVHFEDPKVAVGVVATRGGQILLTRRNHEPKLGEWSFPAGFVDAGENVVEAAVRETCEETGIHVQIGQLLGVFQERDSRVVFLAYAASAGAEEPICGDECLDVRYFPINELPALAFENDSAILAAWRDAVARPRPTTAGSNGNAG